MKVHRQALAVLLLTSLVSTQQQVISPSGIGYDAAGGSDSILITLPSGVRAVQVIDANATGITEGSITALAFRWSAFYAQAWEQSHDLTISLGTTAFAPLSVPATFDAIPTTPTTQVFQGTFEFPASTTRVIPEPWTTVTFDQPFAYNSATDGNLVIDVTTTSAGTSRPGWLADAHAQDRGGAHYRVTGPGCAAAFTSQPLQTRDQLVPGGELRFSLRLGTPRILSGLSYIGLGQTPTFPLSLASIGAPGCELETDIVVAQAFTLNATLWSASTSVVWSFPNDPGIVGAEIVHQALLVQSNANALGVNFSEGHALRLGSATVPAPAPVDMIVGEPGQPTGQRPLGPDTAAGWILRFTVQ